MLDTINGCAQRPQHFSLGTWRISERCEVMANENRTISRLPDIKARLKIPETRRRGTLRQGHCIKWRFPGRHIGGDEGQSYELIFLICNQG